MTLRAAAPSLRTSTALSHAIEGVWLAAGAVVPLAVVPPDWMFRHEDAPKVFLLRSMALLLVALVALEWGGARRTALQEIAAEGARRWQNIIVHPARMVFLTAAAVSLATLASASFSPVPAVSFGGIDTGTDSYGILSVGSYLVIFGVIATRLRSADQLHRLLWAVCISGMAMSLVGLLQRVGFDPIYDGEIPFRTSLTVGNPIFAGAFLTMTIPLSLGMVMALRRTMSPRVQIVIGAAVVGPQAIAMLLTISRASFIGVTFGVIGFMVAAAWILGLKGLRRPAAILALVAAPALLVPLALPNISGLLVERVTPIPASIADGEGLSSRYDIWRSAFTVYRSGPWVDTDQFPGVPGIAPAVLRPLVGVGPDIYQYVNLTAAGPHFVQHAHNFLVHTLVELASLGLAAYVGLITAVAATLFRLARQARAGRSPLWQSYVVAGLTGTMVGRLVEQIAGKAQIADLLLSWALAAVVVSMAAMASQRDNAPAESSPQPARTNARASSQRGRRGEGKAEAKHPLRLAGAALLTVGLTVIWWQSVVSPVAASVTGAKAAQAGFASQYAETVERYQQAISQDSGVAANHLALAEATKTLATFESSVERRMALLSVADAHLEQVLARNPLDHRARRIQIDVKTEMVRIDPSLLPDAVSAVATLEALQPIYWGPMVQYANLLFVVGDREAAQKAVDRAKRLGLGQPQFEAMYADLNEKFGPGL